MIGPGTDDAAQYARIHAILVDARKLDGAGRDAFLANACGTDEALRARVEDLLALESDEDAHDALGDDKVLAARQGIDALVDETIAPWLPETIGDYTIVRQIGQGGMGVVYEAEQESPRRRVAIKLLHPMHATAERLRRFRQEAEVLGRLQHPGIAQIFEAGTYDIGRGAQPFFAMELVDGVDIRTHCDRNDLNRAERIDMLAHVADAVQYAHERGVIHRDLKPDNVLVDARGHPRVLDFGVARASGTSGTLSTLVTSEGQMVGTLSYMAPEQLRQTADAITPKVDVYALGVLGYELLVGRLPCAIEDLPISQAVAFLSNTEAPRAGTFDATLRGDVETILGAALEPEPDRRYATAAALAGDLRRHLANHPIRARPPSRVYLMRKFARRHRALVAGTLTTLLVLLAGVVVAFVLTARAQDERDIATANATRAHNAVLQSTQTLLDAGRERDAAAQLRLIPDEARGVAWRLLDRAVPFIIDAPPGQWRFVNDDLLVGCRGSVFAAADDPSATISLYSLTEHRILRTLFPGLQVAGLGRPARIGVVSAGGVAGTPGMMLLDLEREVILARHPIYYVSPYGIATIRDPEVSDDGRTVLWYTSESDAEVQVDGAVVRTFRGLAPEESVHLGPDGRILVENRRSVVSVLDIATGARRFQYEFEADNAEPSPEPSTDIACGLPVRGGILFVSGPDQCHGKKNLTIRRLPLTDEGVEPETDDLFASGFVTAGFRYQIAHSSDGHMVAVESPGGATFGNSQTGAPLIIEGITVDAGYAQYGEHPNSTVDISPSGRRVAISSASAQTEIIELDPRENDPQFDQRVMTLSGHTAPGGTADGWVYHVAVSNDGSLIVSAAPLDPLVRLWDTRTGDCIATMKRDCGEPGSWDAFMAFAPEDDRVMLTTPYGGRDVCVVEWNILTGDSAVRAEMTEAGSGHLDLLDAFIDALDPRPGARLSQRAHMQTDRAFAVLFPETHARGDLRSATWRARQGRRWRYVPGIVGTGDRTGRGKKNEGPGWAAGVSVHPTAARVAAVQQIGRSGVRDGWLSVTDTNSDECLAERRLTHRPWCVAYHPDGSVLAIGTDEGLVLLFETEGYTQQLEWAAHEKYVYSLAWTPDGTRLVTASGDATLRIWDTRTRVASLLAEDEWSALQDEMATRDDLRDVFTGLIGVEREAARVELIIAAERQSEQ